MNLDLTKLSPAPWEVYCCGAYDCEDSACGIFGPNGGSLDCSYDECHHPLSLTNATFIVLARNAFDVWMRRRWRVMWTDAGCTVDYTHEEGIFREWLRDGHGLRPDPFTALVEADKWYVANVEKGGSS